MSSAPEYNIDLGKFKKNPYPDLEAMRANAPIAYVPQLGATLFTKRNDIFINEKIIEVFSSLQPNGLMTRLMGANMMRKDGKEHQYERRIISPSVSPKTVKNQWLNYFNEYADHLLDGLSKKRSGELIQEYAMPLSAEALKLITGLTNMKFAEMDRVSQGMIDGCANYSGDMAIEDNCNDCTASIDRHIDEMLPKVRANPDLSLLSVQLAADLDEEQIRANVKLAISGGQNEPRDAIAGTIWALLANPEQLMKIYSNKATWLQAFEEFARWISPIGMSPRQIAKKYTYNDIEFEKDDRVFFMFGSANRDAEIFEKPNIFDVERDTRSSVTFGAGPHYCAGAWISRALIAEVALPKIFNRLPNIRLSDSNSIDFDGWAFRGPKQLLCHWSN
jgi:cytochrome P450